MESLGHVDAGCGMVCLVAGLAGRGSICEPVVEHVGNVVRQRCTQWGALKLW